MRVPRGRLARLGLEVVLGLLCVACTATFDQAGLLGQGEDPFRQQVDPLAPWSPLDQPGPTPRVLFPTPEPVATITPTPAPPTPRPSPTPLPTATPIIPLSELKKTPAPPTRVLGHGLYLPAGFDVGLFAGGLDTVSAMAYASDDVLFVSLPGKGAVVAIQDNGGRAGSVEVFVQGLAQPTGLAFREGYLYVAEAHQVVRFRYEPGRLSAASEAEVVVGNLPVGGVHQAHAIGFGPDDKLYVSIGSSCNVCRETDYRRATIMRYDVDGSHEEVYARGLRDVEAFCWYPGSGQFLATNCGRRRMGEDLPPDTLEIIAQGANYGWPFCHAGDIADPLFGSPEACDGVPRPLQQFPAHTSPKALCVYTGGQFPDEYRGDIFVALNGSWERLVPVGYKVVRIKVEEGQLAGVEDFATGWLVHGQAWGRPSGLIQARDGSLLVSDDRMGAIYRIYYKGQ